MTKPKALGYLRKDKSGIHQQWDEAQMRSLAKRFGYDLGKVIVFGEFTEDPIGELVHAVDRAGAEALFVPGLEHFDGIVPRTLVSVVDVITVSPTHTYARWSTGQLPAEVDGA
ncbi:hypothetical protein [Nocardia paucivorans]|uniref:hypothetical protein n=1 Tax=Nocardia paucivorans TaxID=114259 RepID=UPI0003005805|nr:hypothetical protein [Nocardia paucivorans]